MEFNKARVFTPFNCDEIKIGSKGIVADSKPELVAYVTRSEGQDLVKLKDVDTSLNCSLPFSVGIGCNICHYEYFYLVEEPQESKKEALYKRRVVGHAQETGFANAIA